MSPRKSISTGRNIKTTNPEENAPWPVIVPRTGVSMRVTFVRMPWGCGFFAPKCCHDACVGHGIELEGIGYEVRPVCRAFWGEWVRSNAGEGHTRDFVIGTILSVVGGTVEVGGRKLPQASEILWFSACSL